MKAIFSSKSYWIISILATAIIFAAMFHIGDVYKSETDILLSSENPQIEKNISQTIENVIQISKTLVFYNNILKFNPEIKDQSAGLSDYDRKNYWNSVVQPKRLANSNAIRLSVTGKNQSETEELLRASSSELSWEIKKYYDGDNSISAKIIDGPITGQSKKYNYGILLAVSFIVAFFSVYFSYFISDLFGGKKAGKKILKLSKKQERSSNKLNPEKAKEKLNELLEGRI
ncbi:MAG: hypothetical protein WC906_00955 [Parcubacteria group bacterium]|jgi:capsular polysaccharide biosynthesis protein